MASISTRVPVTVEKTAAGRFVARAEAEGSTAEEAVANLQAEILPAPAQPLQPIRASDQPNAWLAMVGWLPDDDLTAAWRQAMADRRAESEPEA